MFNGKCRFFAVIPRRQFYHSAIGRTKPFRNRFSVGFDRLVWLWQPMSPWHTNFNVPQSVFEVECHQCTQTRSVWCWTAVWLEYKPVLSQPFVFPFFLHENHTDHSLCLISLRIGRLSCQIFSLLLFLCLRLGFLVCLSTFKCDPISITSPCLVHRLRGIRRATLMHHLSSFSGGDNLAHQNDTHLICQTTINLWPPFN